MNGIIKFEYYLCNVKNYIYFVNYVYLDFVSAWIMAMILILLDLLLDNLVYIIINVGNGSSNVLH